MDNKEKILASIKKNPNRTFKQIAGSVRGATFAEVHEVIKEEGITLPKTPVSAKKERDVTAISETDIRQKHDLYFKINQAAQSIEEGKFYTEVDFRECIVRVSAAAFRRPADDDGFVRYKGRASGITYWGHPKSIQKLKDERVLL